jgi:hypothetical protein
MARRITALHAHFSGRSRIADTGLQAVAQFAPDRLLAASQARLNLIGSAASIRANRRSCTGNWTIGGRQGDPRTALRAT